MSKSNTYENELQLFTFNQATPGGIGTTLYCALHTADPGEGGDQTTNECAYPNYTRVGVNRTAGGWTVSGPTSTNTAEILFPTCGAGSETITHFSVGVAASSTSKILYSGALSSQLIVSNNIAPRFIASSVTITED